MKDVLVVCSFALTKREIGLCIGRGDNGIKCLGGCLGLGSGLGLGNGLGLGSGLGGAIDFSSARSARAIHSRHRCWRRSRG
jgi:hypothetical protein